MNGKTLLLPLFLFAAVLLSADEFYTSFARGKWDRSQWLNVKGPRFSYVLEMVQNDDHIANPVPDEPDDIIFRKYDSKVYAALVLDRTFDGNLTVASMMSFDHRMAPLLVIAPELGKSEDGKYHEFREHYEIVLYDQGINVWHHLWRDGKPYWYKAAWLKAAFQPKKIYELQVQLVHTAKGCQLSARCDGHELGYTEFALKEGPYYVGLIACEGRNRFYDFKVESKPVRKRK